MAVVALPRSARAQQEDPKVVARSKLVDGGELLKRGDYQEALARFKEAYDLVQSPKIQYNFGLAYRGLGRHTDAIEAFDKFLNDATDASPDLRANAERFRSELAQQTGTVLIDCDLEGAEISVDGRSYGATPSKGPIRLDPGLHQVVVEKAGVPPFTRKVLLVPGQRLSVAVEMARSSPAAPNPNPAPPKASSPTVEPGPPPTPAPPAPESTRDWKWKVGWGATAGAVAFLGFGIVERLRANSKFSDFNSEVVPRGAEPAGKCDADGRVLNHGGGNCSSLLSAGNSAATLATVGLVAGGALAAGAVALLTVSWRAKHQDTVAAAVSCGPVLAQEPGLLCGLRF
jgi:hypothetical protein